MFDFHTHTFLSDGVLSPIELIRRAIHVGYRAMAITDHVGPGNMEFILKTLIADCEMANSRWDILALPGVEITHTPSEDIDRLARECRRLGAVMVNVHGETITEPVAEGTNLAAVSSGEVDILAHPGLITLDEARIAAANGVFLEVSGRKGHGMANGHVVQTASAAGAKLVLDSDAHAPEDLLSRDFAMKVARGSGLDLEDAVSLLDSAPLDLLDRVGVSRGKIPGPRA
jgi:histidinol phosphatase-like PHP family hydrolase